MKMGMACMLLAAAVMSARAELFSFENKYRLSFDALDSLRAALFDSAAAPFFALPNDIEPAAPPAVRYAADGQVLRAGVFIRSTGDLDDAAFHPNGYAGARIDYSSRYLSAAVQCDVHSDERSPVDDFADSLADIRTEQFVSGAEHISGTGSMDFNFPTGYLRLNARPATLAIGKFKLRWGPGYKGTLAQSGAALSPFYWYHLQVAMGNALRAQCYLAQFDDEFLFPDSTGATPDAPGRYGAGQRVDMRLGRHVQIGLYELVNFWGGNLLSRYANPVQVYYFSNIAGGPAEGRTNIMGGGDLSVVAGPWRWYGEFLNDDITVFDHNRSPNKFAFQAGSVCYGKSILREVGAEYTHVAWGVYTHWYPGLNRHVYWNEPRGWPWGNDQDVWSAHILMQPRDHLRLYGELAWWIKGDGTLDLYHWDYFYAHNKTPAPGHGDNQGGFQDYAKDRHLVSLALQADWRPLNYLDIGAIYQPAFADGKMDHFARVYMEFDVPMIWNAQTR